MKETRYFCDICNSEVDKRELEVTGLVKTRLHRDELRLVVSSPDILGVFDVCGECYGHITDSIRNIRRYNK